MTRSYCSPLTEPPPIDVRTFRLKPSLFDRRSSAASLFSGSDAFGSRNRNYKTSVLVRALAPYQIEDMLCLLEAIYLEDKLGATQRETYLQPNNDSIQVQHRFPILS